MKCGSGLRGFALIAGSAIFLSLAGGARAEGEPHYAPNTKLTVEALILGRDRPSATPFTGPDVVGGPFVSFGPENLTNNPAGGVRAMLTHRIHGGWLNGSLVEIGGFWAGRFSSSGTVFDVNQSGTNATYDDDAHLNPGATVVTTNSDDLFALRIRIRSSLAGGELNLVPRDLPYGTWRWGNGELNAFAGARYVFFGEKLESTAFDEQNDFNGTDNDIDRARIVANNHLIGGHLGITGHWRVHPQVELTGRAAFGLFANLVRRDRRFSSDDNVANAINDSLSGTRFAQMAEVKLGMKVMLNSGLYLTAGGNLFWLNGVTEAGRHFSTVTTGTDRNLRAGGSALFYGGHVGLVLRLN